MSTHSFIALIFLIPLSHSYGAVLSTESFSNSSLWVFWKHLVIGLAQSLTLSPERIRLSATFSVTSGWNKYNHSNAPVPWVPSHRRSHYTEKTVIRLHKFRIIHSETCETNQSMNSYGHQMMFDSFHSANSEEFTKTYMEMGVQSATLKVIHLYK